MNDAKNSTTTDSKSGADSRPEHGPNPGMLALLSWLLFAAGLVVSAAMSGGEALSSPFGPSSEVAARIRENHDAIRVAAFFQFGSAITLGIYAATVYSRLLRVRVPGPVIGLVGGVIAVMSLLVSAFTTFAQSRPEITSDDQLVHALAFFGFAAGGPGYVVGLGLLIAGLAVPAFILRLIPRPVAAIGVVIAVLAELSWFGMLAEPLQYLLPVGRFLGGIWIIVAGFMLSTQRTRRNEGVA